MNEWVKGHNSKLLQLWRWAQAHTMQQWFWAHHLHNMITLWVTWTTHQPPLQSLSLRAFLKFQYNQTGSCSKNLSRTPLLMRWSPYFLTWLPTSAHTTIPHIPSYTLIQVPIYSLHFPTSMPFLLLFLIPVTTFPHTSQTQFLLFLQRLAAGVSLSQNWRESQLNIHITRTLPGNSKWADLYAPRNLGFYQLPLAILI